MGDDFFRQLRKSLVLGSFFSGASSLSKLFNETEAEIEDVIKYVDEKVDPQKIFGGKFNRNKSNGQNSSTE